MEVTYDSSKPEMQRVKSILVNGKALTSTQNYTVSTTSFVAKGGDGFEVFTRGRIIAANTVIIDALIEGFSDMEAVWLPPFGRQVDVSQTK